jgi:phthiocerol/phenolphthiocerol synthesis type-I polyketide synthase D
MKLSLMFFSCSLAHEDEERYELLLKAARFADQHGFEAIWLPERHFGEIGYLYPAPAVLHAALARETTRIALRAGSVVLPINDSIRVAEQWSVVDNLSGGRVGVSFAPGWNPEDFALAPSAYEHRYEHLARGIDEVVRLWRGERISRVDGTGKDTEVRLLPPPVQARLPLWMTSAGSEGSIRNAARAGANLLTHLFDQGVAELAEKVALYRRTRAEAGLDPASGIVTVMVHTFVGADEALTRSEARQPYCEFLASNIKILEGLAASKGKNLSIGSLRPDEAYAFAEFVYERFCRERALIGSVDGCAEVARALETAGVDELACLIDFGVPTPRVLASLDALARLHDVVTADSGREAADLLPSAVRLPVDAVRVDAARFYADAERYGASYGSSFRAVERLWIGKSAAVARVELSPGVGEDAAAYRVHPALLDNAFLLSSALTHEQGSGVALPAGVERFVVRDADVGRRVFVSARLRASTESEWALTDVDIFAPDGKLVAEARGLRFQLLRHGRDEVKFDPTICLSEAWVDLEGRVSDSGPGEALIIDRNGELGAGVGRALAHAGWRVSHASDEASELSRAFADRAAAGALTVINLTALDPSADLFVEGDGFPTRDGSFRQLELVRALLELCPDAGVRCHFVTRAGIRAQQGESPRATQAAIAALVQVAAAEHPRLGLSVIDLAPTSTLEADAAGIARIVSAAPHQPAICVRAERDLAARLTRVAALPRAWRRDRLDSSATYLLVGGAGGLGLTIAGALLARGARNLMLTGRRALDESPTRKEAVERLRAQGANVTYVINDLTKPGAGAALANAIASEPNRLAGVVHLATVIEPALVERTTHLAWHRTLAAKADSAYRLHEVLGARELDFCMFISAVPAKVPWTALGASAYAAANAVLDALVHLRRERGLVATGINFGPWAGVGAAVELFGEGDALSRQGLGSLQPSEALEAFFGLLESDVPCLVVARCDWQRMAELHPMAKASSLLSELVDAREPPTPHSAEWEGIQGCAPHERLVHLQRYLAQLVSEVLECPVERIDIAHSLNSYGLDSLTALEARNRMERRLGLAIPLVTFLEGPSIEQLASRLLPSLRLEANANREIEELVI